MLRPACELTDEDLLLRVQGGDELAFAELHERFVESARRVARGVIRDTGRVDDIVQEAFLDVWRRSVNFSIDRGRAATWLLAIVRHRAIDELRRQQSRPTILGEPDDHHLVSSQQLEGEVIERTQAETVRRMLATLPDKQRHVLALAYFGGLSHTEIAREMDLPLGTAKGVLRHGLIRMRLACAALL